MIKDQHDGLKLGALPLTEEHRRMMLPLGPYLTKPLPPPQPRVDNTDGVAYGLYGNDQFGNCTEVMVANYFSTAEIREGRPDPNFATADAVETYLAYTGGQDTGLYEIDVLASAVSDGFPKKTGKYKLDAWVRIDPRDHKTVKAAIGLFWGVMVGAALPLAAKYQTKWSYNGSVADTTPGSWGPHAMFCPVYDDDSGFEFVTWGRRRMADFDWWDRYVIECYIPLDKRRGMLQGVDMSKLRADMEALKS